MLNIGDILDEKYRILDLLGKGGMGRVFLAENIKLGNKWAVKEIDLARETKVDLLAEPEILKKINHSSLPRIVDIIKVDDFLYVIEDYFAGVSMKELIKARDRCTEKNVLHWAQQLCEILAYLHNLQPLPIIYRDMKPANIIIDSENNVKLIDFGIAREYKEGQESDTTYIGTRGYAAPEQYSGANQTDERTDIYGLGATLYHILTGNSPSDPPYYMVPVRQLNPSLSEGMEKIIGKCVENDPKLRYQTVAELVQDLNNIDKLAHSYQVKKRAYKLAAAALVLVLLGAYFTYQHFQTEQEISNHQAYVQLLEQAATAFDQGNYTQSEAHFQSALQYGPSQEVFVGLARNYLKKNANQQAREFLMEKLNQGQLESDLETLYLLGIASSNLTEYKQAVYYFEKASQLGEQNQASPQQLADTYRDLAVCYANLGQVDKAESIIAQKLATGNLNDPRITYIQGHLSALKGDFAGAVSKFQQAVTADPSNLSYKLDYAKVLSQFNQQGLSATEKRNNYQKALALLSEAHQIDANNIRILNELGKLSYEFGAFSEAQGHSQAPSLFQQAASTFSKMVELGYQTETIYLNLGVIYLQIEDLAQAEANLQQALQLNPDSSRANLHYGLLELKRKNYESAKKYLTKTVNLNQDTGDVALAQRNLQELTEKGW